MLRYDTRCYFNVRSKADISQLIVEMTPLNRTSGKHWHESSGVFVIWHIADMQSQATLDDFERMRTLGTGSFGRVMLVQHKSTKRYHAMKILDKQKVFVISTLPRCLLDRIALTICFVYEFKLKLSRSRLKKTQ